MIVVDGVKYARGCMYLAQVGTDDELLLLASTCFNLAEAN